MSKSNHFADVEFFCPCVDAACSGKRAPHPELLPKLEVICRLFGHALTINSGVRCPKYNKAVGGVAGSAHETGEAADLRCAGSRDRMNLVRAALKAGIRRVGVAKTFIHVDVSQKHDPDVLWLY